jgi:hypothetical protein
MKTYQNNQLEVNPSGVVLVMGCHFPGATPGLAPNFSSHFFCCNNIEKYIDAISIQIFLKLWPILFITNF